MFFLLKLLFIFFILIFSCYGGKRSAETLPSNHIINAQQYSPEDFTGVDDDENENYVKTNQYMFEFRNNTYYRMNDLSYFLAATPVKSLKFYRGTFFDLTPLAALQDLEELSIEFNENITDISPLSSLINLEKLTLFNYANEEDIEAISSLINLRYLELLHKNKHYMELIPLQQLETLKLYNAFPFELDVIYISQLHSLKELEITPGTQNIININLLKNLVNLEKLYLYGVKDINLLWLPNLQKLTKLELFRCTINDISPLAELPNLVDVYLTQSDVKDIMPLLESKSIKRIIGPIVENESHDLFQRFKERGIEFRIHRNDR